MTLAQNASAGSQDINITGGPWRTSACYQYNNYWYGSELAPISKNANYFWGYEDRSFTYPAGGPVSACANETGRGFVYGTISNLQSYTSHADYKTKIKTLPAGCSPVNNGVGPLFWSPFSGEESIVYVNCTDGKIKKMDISPGSPTWTTVCQWSDIGKSGGDSGTTMYGWDSSNRLVGIYGGRIWQSTDAVSCDVQTGIEYDIDFSSSSPTCDWPGRLGAQIFYIDRVQMGSNGHSHKPPDSANFAAYYGDGGVGRFSGSPNCVYTADNDPFLPYYGFHIDWKYSPDWFITDLSTDPQITTPGIMTQAGALQHYFDRSTMTYTEIRRFLTHSTARPWKNGATQVNWNSMILISMGIGGNAVAYTATNGKYSYSDYLYNPSLYGNWEPDSMWIALVNTGEAVSTPPPTPSPSDTIPPVISNVSVSNITQTSVQISWSLNEPATGQVEYGLTANYGLNSILEPSFNYSAHIQNLSSLTPGTLYHFRVKSKDATGNLAVSNDFTFTTLGSSPIPTLSSCDLNQDTKTNILDFQLLANVILGLSPNTGGYDINKDGQVNILDTQVLANVILGKTSCP